MNRVAAFLPTFFLAFIFPFFLLLSHQLPLAAVHFLALVLAKHVGHRQRLGDGVRKAGAAVRCGPRLQRGGRAVRVKDIMGMVVANVEVVAQQRGDDRDVALHGFLQLAAA